MINSHPTRVSAIAQRARVSLQVAAVVVSAFVLSVLTVAGN